MSEVDSQKRDAASRWWRPVGFWGLTLGTISGFPAVVVLAILTPDSPAIGTVSSAYGTLLLAWVAAAGVRQWGKNNGTEASYDQEG